jgi:MbtH protein
MDGYTTFAVVVNDEEQYSIWPTERELPAGWSPVRFTGSRDECLGHIAEIWNDMRPRASRVARAS